MNSSGLRRVLELVQIEEYASGEIIFNKHDDPDFAFMVLFGQVYLYDRPDDVPSVSELSLVSRATKPSMKKVEAGGLIGHETFMAEQKCGGAYRTSTVAFNGESPSLVLRMNAEAYDLIVYQHYRYRQEQRTIFFHEHLP